VTLRWASAGLVLVTFALAAPVLAQTQTARKPATPAKKPAPAATVPPKTELADMICPTPLGIGIRTKVAFCDVMSSRDPSAGVLIKLPPHQGPVTLTFNLHNRHTYSEDQVTPSRAFSRYTATVGVLTMDNTLISRAVVQSEFRRATDFVDRVSGGAGPGGAKAVAPTGTEPVSITIPEDEQQVSILGEKVTVERLDGTATYSSTGRPIAVISNVQVEYRPAPPPKPVRPGAPRPMPAKKP
jgi:hypothetical protein